MKKIFIIFFAALLIFGMARPAAAKTLNDLVGNELGAPEIDCDGGNTCIGVGTFPYEVSYGVGNTGFWNVAINMHLYLQPPDETVWKCPRPQQPFLFGIDTGGDVSGYGVSFLSCPAINFSEGHVMLDAAGMEVWYCRQGASECNLKRSSNAAIYGGEYQDKWVVTENGNPSNDISCFTQPAVMESLPALANCAFTPGPNWDRTTQHEYKIKLIRTFTSVEQVMLVPFANKSMSDEISISIDVRNCCGNGTEEGKEECDNGDKNSDTAPNACRLNCTKPYCGDTIFDNKTTIRTPAEDNTFRTWDWEGPEQCDLGSKNSDASNSVCRTYCTKPYCGDGVVDNTTIVYYQAGENGWINHPGGFTEQCDNGPKVPIDQSVNGCQWCRTVGAPGETGAPGEPGPTGEPEASVSPSPSPAHSPAASISPSPSPSPSPSKSPSPSPSKSPSPSPSPSPLNMDNVACVISNGCLDMQNSTAYQGDAVKDCAANNWSFERWPNVISDCSPAGIAGSGTPYQGYTCSDMIAQGKALFTVVFKGCGVAQNPASSWFAVIGDIFKNATAAVVGWLR